MATDHPPAPGSSDSVTMKDIAEKAGVSIMTVSRALRNHRKVGAATREKIVKVASELGYHQNPLVSATMAKVARARKITDRPIIAFVTTFKEKDYGHYLPHIVKMKKAAEARAEALGLQVQEFHFSQKDLSEARLSNILIARGVDGGILAPLSDDEHLSLYHERRKLNLNYEKLAWVTICQSFNNDFLDNVSLDYFGSLSNTLKSLEERGYRRVGLALTTTESSRTQNQLLSCYMAIRYFNPKYRTHYIPPFIGTVWDQDNLNQLPHWVHEHSVEVVMANKIVVFEKLLSLPKQDRPLLCSLESDLIDHRWADFALNQRPDLLASMAVDTLYDNIKINRTGVPESPRISHIRTEFVDYRALRDA